MPTSTNLALFIAGLSGTAVFTIILGIGMQFRRQGPLYRLQQLHLRETQEHVAVNTAQKHRQGVLSRTFEAIARRVNRADRIEQELRLAGMNLFVGEFLSLLAMCMSFGILFGLWVGNFILAIVLALAGYIVPRQWLGIRSRRRMRKIEKQLPEFINMLANSLKASNTINQSIIYVSQEIHEPIADELEFVADNLHVGLSLQESLLLFAEAIPSNEVQLLVNALIIEQESGGDIIQALDRLGELIRDRIKFDGEVVTITASQRYSGYMMALLPVVFALLLMLVNPSYMLSVFQTTVWYGWFMLGTAVTFIVVGLVVMLRLVDIQV